MKPKIIRTKEDYEETLARIDVLIDHDPVPESPEGEELALLSLLVERFEAAEFPMDLPSPVEAIRFRMEQQGLKKKDLLPYIGSASKVSDVLAGKRPLSLNMIRQLVKGLGIPAEVLLQEAGSELPCDEALQQGRHFPLAEMLKRGWFEGFTGTTQEAKSQLEEVLNRFTGPLGRKALLPSLNRQHVRDGGKQDPHALNAWRIRVASLAMRENVPEYRKGTVNAEFMSELVKLSYLSSGPLLAKEFLNRNGIRLICERHLPKTHLDGAALRLPDESPVVALTLRHDRLDNFWFTLFHELAHIALHLDQGDVEAFFDDLTKTGTSQCEKEADELAEHTLIPPDRWKAARLGRNSTPDSVVRFAEQTRISPAIVAGRIRFLTKDYTVLKSLIGSGKVRAMFGIAA